MKNNKIVAILIMSAIAFFVIPRNLKTDKELKSLSELNTRLSDSLHIYQDKLDSIDMVLSAYQDSINYLTESKNKIKRNYERRIEDILNPDVVSDDSITQYISSKIYPQW